VVHRPDIGRAEGPDHHDVSGDDPADHQHPYDIPYHWAMGRFYQDVVEVAAERVATVVEGRSVVEMGCGDGFMTAKIARRARAVFGFDMNERAVAFAEMIVRSPNVRFEVGRAQDLEAMTAQLEEPVEVVASFEVIEHLSAGERDAFLEASRRILAPHGGSIVLTTPNGARRPGHKMNPHHEHEFTPDELGGLLRRNGFLDVRIEGLYLQPPWPERLEHLADTVPFRAGFRRLARAGRSRPGWCRTLVSVGRAG
jgi:SAM-dependent methyltransferase